jgi:cyclase
VLTKRIIPCLDIKDGRTVKGVNFEGLRDAGDPVELAALYSHEGADELVFLDISATGEKRRTLREMVERVAREVSIPFTVGGGISDADDVYALLRCGADKVSVNSAAVRDPQLLQRLSDRFGSQCIVLAVDAKQVNDHWKVHLVGGKVATDIDLFDWVREAEQLGAGEVLFTSMDHDGTKNGFANDALRKMAGMVRIPIIASGGAGNMQHFADAFTEGMADAALAASVFHFKEMTVPALKRELARQGIPVRQRQPV